MRDRPASAAGGDAVRSPALVAGGGALSGAVDDRLRHAMGTDRNVAAEHAVSVPVPAKVNLSLHVVGQRADGYHLLDSLVVFTEAAYDRLDVTFWADAPGENMGASPSGHGMGADASGDDMGPDLTASGPFASALPPGRDNAVMATARRVGGIRSIHLRKGLPVASGLGGGAADAAGVLRAAVLAGRITEEAAFAMALSLGADVPVCLLGRACRMEGIGETLTPVPARSLPVVLVNPGAPVETRAVFARLASKSNGPMAGWSLASPDAAVATVNATRNDLMAPAVAEAPVIGAVVARLGGAPGCRVARMSGSGASVFGIFEDDDSAAQAAENLATREGWWTSATRFAAAR